MRKRMLSDGQIEEILALARGGKNAMEISMTTGRPRDAIRRLCRARDVQIVYLRPNQKNRPAPAEEAARMEKGKAAVHPLVAMGDGQSALEHARAILRHKQLLWTRGGQPWLNDRYATPFLILKAANEILKAAGQPQLGSSENRV